MEIFIKGREKFLRPRHAYFVTVHALRKQQRILPINLFSSSVQIIPLWNIFGQYKLVCRDHHQDEADHQQQAADPDRMVRKRFRQLKSSAGSQRKAQNDPQITVSLIQQLVVMGL